MRETLSNLVESYGYVALFVLIALESLGIPLPGESALVSAAARAGEPTASTPRMMNATPHKIDHVEACRTISDGLCCVIEASSMDGQSVLLRRNYGVPDF